MRTASSDSVPVSIADSATCGAMLRGGSRTFFAASLVLPKALREPATALYAFCRMADDAIDQGEDRAAALADLHRRLEAIYRGAPHDRACDRAFAKTVVQFEIPKALPLALLEGFAWDAENRQYESFSQLTGYAVRVAGTVGMMMAMIMGVRDEESLARAADLGVAMQLTNIARDVGEDARCGRIYLPHQWLREAAIDPQSWLAAPVSSESLARVTRRLLGAAETLYRRSESGLAQLPRACRPAMYAARLLYAEIGNEVQRRHCDSVNQRAVVAWPRKAALLVEAAIAAVGRRNPVSGMETLPEVSFLLTPMFAGCEPLERTRSSPVERRVVWLINLFERLERSERQGLNEACP